MLLLEEAGDVLKYFTHSVFFLKHTFFFFFLHTFMTELFVLTLIIFFFLLYLDEIASGNQKNPGIQ